MFGGSSTPGADAKLYPPTAGTTGLKLTVVTKPCAGSSTPSADTKFCMAISAVGLVREQNCSVFGRGVFFGYFLDKQKVIKEMKCLPHRQPSADNE
jgi:hypothetical protein